MGSIFVAEKISVSEIAVFIRVMMLLRVDYGRIWVIENCYMNSSCNGIRLIMPATGLKIVDCEFRGPGKISTSDFR